MTIYDLDTPTLLVDLDRLERNIAEMGALMRQHNKKLRPHTKTHKVPEIAQMQLAAGASGLTVAKLGEAEVLAAAGCDDLFLANEIVGESKIERLLDLNARVRMRVGVDSAEVAGPIGALAKQRGQTVGALIEVDTGLGRAGVRSLPELVSLGQFIAETPGLELVGLFSHEGHIYRMADDAARQAEGRRFLGALAEMSAALSDKGIPVPEISIGSTPGAHLFAGEATPTELRPGNYVFLDRMQAHIGANRDQCALTVLASVVSVRSDGRVILDAGTKSLASDCPFPDKTYGEIVGHPELQFVAASEEHGHLQATEKTPLRVGDKVQVIPNHACTCVNMHDTLTAYRGEQVVAEWPIAGRGKIR